MIADSFAIQSRIRSIPANRRVVGTVFRYPFIVRPLTGATQLQMIDLQCDDQLIGMVPTVLAGLGAVGID